MLHFGHGGLHGVEAQVDFIALGIESELFPHGEQEVGRIAIVIDFKRVTEAEAVRIEAKRLEPLVVQVGEKPVALPVAVLLVRLVPNVLHQVLVADVLKMVFDDKSKVAVQLIDHDGIEAVHHVVHHRGLLVELAVVAVGLLEERCGLLFVELAQRHHQCG